jgi:hypothetical protein
MDSLAETSPPEKYKLKFSFLLDTLYCFSEFAIYNAKLYYLFLNYAKYNIVFLIILIFQAFTIRISIVKGIMGVFELIPDSQGVKSQIVAINSFIQILFFTEYFWPKERKINFHHLRCHIDRFLLNSFLIPGIYLNN